MQDFEIFQLEVGGGTLALSPMPGRGGAFAQDLAKLRAWNPAIVVTMVEPQELVAKGADLLQSSLQDAKWVHFPIPDYEIPSALQDTEWPAVQSDLLQALGRGERVLVHCMGGCGRSGMAVLRLMIAAGDAPDVALDKLRKVRPYAVETEAQLNWAFGQVD